MADSRLKMAPHLEVSRHSKLSIFPETQTRPFILYVPKEGTTDEKCADVNFVDSSSFKTQIPCFNATTEQTNEQASGTTTAVSSTSTATSDSSGKFGFGFSKLSVMVLATFSVALVF